MPFSPFPPIMSKRSWEEIPNKGKLNTNYTCANTFFKDSDADDDPDKGEPLDYTLALPPIPPQPPPQQILNYRYVFY